MRVGKALLLLMAAAALTACGACDKTGSGEGGNLISQKRYEVFDDPELDCGMALLAPLAVNGVGVPVDTLRFDLNGRDPVWHLCCWNFKSGLSKEIRKENSYGVTFDDGTYLISRDKSGNICMEVTATNVYREPRTEGSQPWINLLIETSFSANVELKKTNSLMFSYDLCIKKCENKMGDAYNTNIHAAQCLAYLYVRNTNKDSRDYMKSLWLGVGSFDNRDQGGLSRNALTMWDIGTSTYMYGLSDEKLFGDIDFNDGKWHSCRVNVRESVGDAIKALVKEGFMKDSVVDDFTVMGMNYGWELPGTFNVSSKVRNFSLNSSYDYRGEGK